MTEQAALVAEGDRVRDDSGMKLKEGWELRRHITNDLRYGTCHLRKWMEATTLEARLCCGRVMGDQYEKVGPED
eukprot:1413993-Amphidinium_carterae.1